MDDIEDLSIQANRQALIVLEEPLRSRSLARREQLMPAFTWEQLERQLRDLTDTPAKAAIVAPLVSGLRKQSRWKPPELVLRETLCLAWTLMDESFQPGLFPGEEADMP
jgi:hypothetical protein